MQDSIPPGGWLWPMDAHLHPGLDRGVSAPFGSERRPHPARHRQLPAVNYSLALYQVFMARPDGSRRRRNGSLVTADALPALALISVGGCVLGGEMKVLVPRMIAGAWGWEVVPWGPRLCHALPFPICIADNCSLI